MIRKIHDKYTPISDNQSKENHRALREKRLLLRCGKGGRMRFRQTFIARVFLFIVFLTFLAIVLKGMGWAIGGMCEAGADLLLK
ncbi:MAG: hypothetical protein ACI4SY_05680 [Sutterella sp.]